jgi:fluoride ion exporter CrcB/FEX
MFLRRIIAESLRRMNVGAVAANLFGAFVAGATSGLRNSAAKTRVVPWARKKAQRASVARMIAAESRFCRGVATKGY